MNRLVFVAVVAALVAGVCCAKDDKPAAAAATAGAEPPRPVIMWGTCPQLEPSEDDKKSKAKILADCIKEHPVPAQITEQTVAVHQMSIAECALKKENWFDKDGSYKFDKAESEIKKKKLAKAMEAKLMEAHGKCRTEAKTTHKEAPVKGGNNVPQVQFYQACMDFHITKACNIQVKDPAAPAQ